jgi:hypothetical protein
MLEGGNPFPVPKPGTSGNHPSYSRIGRKGLRYWRRTKMKFKTLIAAAVMTAVAVPAFAQSFYVVQDVKTKKCTITETKPTSSEVTVVSGDSVYKTKTEVETGMKTIKVCTSN